MRNDKPNPYAFDWSKGIAVKTENSIKWVQLSDYEKLQAENEKLKLQVEAFKCAFHL